MPQNAIVVIKKMSLVLIFCALIEVMNRIKNVDLSQKCRQLR